ncbi:hypothetical protein, partial [Raoultella planticola]|uniref:hypothetical protein n=1 Tax=Raoultella planticola TaxID=575 RepID=UPI001CCCF7EA
FNTGVNTASSLDFQIKSLNYLKNSKQQPHSNNKYCAGIKRKNSPLKTKLYKTCHVFVRRYS